MYHTFLFVAFLSLNYFCISLRAQFKYDAALFETALWLHNVKCKRNKKRAYVLEQKIILITLN